MKSINLFLAPFLIMISMVLCTNAVAQQRKIPKDPFQFADSSTGKSITEVLVLPRYSSFAGVSTMLGEGPDKGKNRDYLDKPFIYKTGQPFRLNLPKSGGFPLPPFLFIGKGRAIESVLFIAPLYRPYRITDLWTTGAERNLKFTPITDGEWSSLLEKELNSLVKNDLSITNNCRFWDLADKCNLEINYDAKEYLLVQTFLRQHLSKGK